MLIPLAIEHNIEIVESQLKILIILYQEFWVLSSLVTDLHHIYVLKLKIKGFAVKILVLDWT